MREIEALKRAGIKRRVIAAGVGHLIALHTTCCIIPDLDTRRENPQYCLILLVAQAFRSIRCLDACDGRATNRAPHGCDLVPLAQQES
jgi:hypothetical protein